MIKIGDTVARKSYNCDLIFEVIEIIDERYVLHGKTVRLIADAYIDDLELVDDDEVRKAYDEEEEELIEMVKSYKNKNNRHQYITGKILHIDGDSHYMNRCMDLYKKLNIYAVGISIQEKTLPSVIIKYIEFLNPDIIIITGHDSYNKKSIDDIKNYRNSRYFIEATKIIRKSYPVLNQPIIIAGACQSNFEALIAAGANFASSPERVNIKSLDPAIIAVKCATTPISELINAGEAINKTSSKNLGLGGLSSFGTMKTLIY